MTIARAVIFLPVTALFSFAADAAAQDREDPITVGLGPRVAQSPQHFAAEIRFAAFTPQVDSDPALHGATPYADVFGTKPRLLVSGEIDWQALRIPHFGSIGPGFGVGYTSAGGDALFTSPHGPSGTLISGETTKLQIFPFYLAAVVRADVLWRDVRIPVVPYAKVGLGYALWRASNTLGTSTAGGVIGEGASVGTHVALGLSVNLNPLDAYAAAGFDDAMGVNGTYVFAEWTREDLDGLGIQHDPLRVGGTSWTFGLAFEF